MKLLNNKLGLSVATALLLSTSAFADTASDIAELKKEIADLKELSRTLVDETSDLKTGFNYTKVDSTKSYSGMGAAASKVYYSKSPLSIGGYGKMDYYHKSKEGSKNADNIDVYRFIPYIGYKFTDNIIMNAEIEFEHGGAEDGATGDGYVIIEFMYLDFLFNENINLRVGNMLVPMGLVNERHEPTLFTTVQRPNTSKKLIPSTWHENGLMAYGNITDDLSYKVGGFSALQLERGSKEGNNWLRESRLGSFRADEKTERLGLAVVTRVDYTGINGLLVGASAYLDSDVTMADVHFDYSIDAFRAYGVYTQTNRSGARTYGWDHDDDLLTPNKIVNEAKKAKGGFINLGYDVLSLTQSKNKMPVFVQYETVSAQDELHGGDSVDSTDTITVGINYFPHEQVVLKADYAMEKDNGNPLNNEDETNIFSLSMGFIF
ncbi:porin [Candidatus Sulfurimonas baltica]|uniref:Porin n=1 Tax=Candidatus Sulfurimonas baltica TaxID=2740404 RepID=A0A7S7LX24_9BACT|nr:porin [Candidatus Sulfurimonas baltica]QOY53048.1 porin [Candidatus Sulfurimonas baltica]